MTGAPDVRADLRESGEISISLPGWLAYASAGAARDIAGMITKCGSAAQVDVFVFGANSIHGTVWAALFSSCGRLVWPGLVVSSVNPSDDLKSTQLSMNIIKSNSLFIVLWFHTMRPSPQLRRSSHSLFIIRWTRAVSSFAACIRITQVH
jgi:hypothetical protein